MKPKPYVQLQALTTLLVSVVALVFLGSQAADATAPALTLGAAIWLWFGWRYRHRRLAWPEDRSSTRAARDKVMVQCFAIGLALPAALAWIVAIAGPSAELVTPPVGDGQNVIVGLCVVLIPLSILVSSSVDWYLIRAFREGVYGQPSCRTAGTPESVDHVRHWVMHRFACEVVLWLAVTVGIAFITAAFEEGTSSDSGKTMLNLVGLLGILGWTYTEMAKLKPALDFIRYPNSVGLGDWAEGENHKGKHISGFVLDVALEPGVQLIEQPRGYPARDVSKPECSVPLAERETLSPLDPPRPLCQTSCEFWVPDCEVGIREIEREADPPPRERDLIGQATRGPR